MHPGPTLVASHIFALKEENLVSDLARAQVKGSWSKNKFFAMTGARELPRINNFRRQRGR
jgi:hypothetical protein